ncbi:carboxylesterase/lipase family protein [Sphingomonas panacis]|uniref:carboxylesterase/lipase family protein n=1 Tax=Sphingomonas panacis TaxID=1560345 RepID=UPI000AEB93E5|nr:carboxylesterase family protein [Sphingomonas panacis]
MGKRPIVHAFALLAAALATAASAAPRVELDSGAIEGKADHDLNVFLGIPYAKPPVGELRWRAPEPLPHWTAVRPTTSFSASCYQTEGKPFGPFTREFVEVGRRSEDCLYLNVWAPAKPAKALPVLVFIHGGGFGSGSTAVPVYTGAGLARRGVIVVTINYRLGAFGFLAHPALTAESPLKSSGNYGILDMIAALRWVKANIAQFGGDPQNVTISGQSAGAAAVSDLLVSPQAKGLFARTIIQSGPGLGVNMLTLDQAEQTGLDVARKLNAQSIAQLRAVASDAIVAATASPPPSKNAVPRILMAPNLDGKIVAMNPESADGRAVSDVPVMAGFNKDEAFIFGVPHVTPDAFVEYVKTRYGNFTDRFLALYPHATTEEASRSMDEMGRDRYMAQLILWAERHVAAEQQPLYLYQFDHSYPGLDAKRFGAFHTAEVPYVLGALDIAGIPFTDTDHQVSRQMEDRWVAFMTGGDPNVPDTPHWTSWREGPGKIMHLGDNPGISWPVSDKTRLDVFRAYVAAGGQLSLF